MDDQVKPVGQLIVVGSSAGGIDALSELVATLPETMPVPIVVAQHLDPRRPSHLAEILQRRSRLPVRVVSDVEPLVGGVVLVLPPNRDAEVSERDVRIHPVEGPGAKPSIDTLFSSAARAFAEGVIAVILTGTGSDGAIGARRVKASGGMVVIQNPETASYPSMPQAIPPSVVDIVADLETIGPLLNDLATGRFEPSRPDEDRLLRGFLDQLRDRTGIDFSAYKRATIMRRLQRRMAATNSPRLRDYVALLQSNPDEYQRLTSSFLIKVTEFFRDADLFGHLRDEVIPRLVADARGGSRELRLWSAGCATGEEAYSLAILLSDALGDELPQFNVHIFATDVDAGAIAFARRGVYPAGALEGMSPDIVEPHFSRTDDHYEISKEIRALTVFGQHDLGQRAPFPRIDLALCRNVLIYFTPDLQKRALQLFAFSLRDNGYLVLGKAESTTPLAEYFVLEQPRLKVYRRQGERVLIPPARIRDTASIPMRPPLTRRLGFVEQARHTTRESARHMPSTERADLLLLRLPVGVLLVDRHYDIQSINASARALLGIHGSAVGEDLLHHLPDGPATTVRGIVDAAFRGEASSVVEEFPTPALEDQDVRTVQIACQPVGGQDRSEAVESVVVLATDVTMATRARRALEVALHDEQAGRASLVEQSKLLTKTNAELQAANEELTTANAELRSANEDLLVANEEVQAATEEVETLNEELQATNEELETLNEELQATVEELNTTNDDLQSRSMELNETSDALARQRDSFAGERNQLVALLDLTDEPVAVVARSGQVIVANRAYRERLADATMSRDDGSPMAADDSPVARAARAEQGTCEVLIGTGERWSAETQPFEVNGSTVGLLIFRPLG